MRNATNGAYGIAYVLADNPETAYKTMLDDLTARSLGFEKDREMHTVELVAEDATYPACGMRVYVA
jgi:hypothetical protein